MTIGKLFSFSVNWDVVEPWQYGFQDSASPVMEQITEFHNLVMFYVVLILISVMWVLFKTLVDFSAGSRAISHKFLIHGTFLEIVWTITPAFILLLIAYPSFKLLYLMDEIVDPGITVKAVGHQWYWSYEYSDYAMQDGTSLNFDSYMVPTSDLEEGELRLLEVDNRLVVPVSTHVRVVISSADVLHCWAVPSLGVKLDAVPGRLNQTSFLADRAGVFYGQCSEICGANHAFMPIVVEAKGVKGYCSHIESLMEEERE
jgi:cytochrome c oxidase subunit 2